MAAQPQTLAPSNPGSGNPHNLETCKADYLRWCRIEGQTPATLAVKDRDISRFLRWLSDQGHSLLADELEATHILAYVEDLMRLGRKPNTLRHRVNMLKSWGKWLAEWGIIQESPTKRVKLPKVPRESRGFVSSDGFSALLRACTGPPLVKARRTAMLQMLATTGLRRNEIHSLTPEDLAYEEGVIRVRKGKGQKERWAPFSKGCQKAVYTYQRHCPRGAKYLWYSWDQRPMTYHRLGEDMRELARRAGLDLKDAVHVFRRTFAANAVRQGIPRQYIMNVLGWSRPDMLDSYVRDMEAETGPALEAFEGFSPFGK